MVEPYLIACGALLLGSVLARALPVTRRSFDDDYEDGWDLTPRELAYLKRGAYGVVLTVLAELHGHGAVDLSRGRVELPDLHDRRGASPAADDRLAVAVGAALAWSRHPRLVALAPRVRRACAPLRADLRERRLLPPARRRLFAAALLVYAGGLATGVMLENGLRGSTVVSAVGVWGVAGLLALGPRRTLAGARELAWHRRALARVAAASEAEAAYLADLVAAYGCAAVRVLCGGPIPSGALAPPAPSDEPVRPAPVPVPAPPVVTPAPPARVPAYLRPVLVPVPPPVVPEFPVPAPPVVTPAPPARVPAYLRPVLVPVPPPAVPEFPVVELPVRRRDPLPVAA